MGITFLVEMPKNETILTTNLDEAFKKKTLDKIVYDFIYTNVNDFSLDDIYGDEDYSHIINSDEFRDDEDDEDGFDEEDGDEFWFGDGISEDEMMSSIFEANIEYLQSNDFDVVEIDNTQGNIEVKTIPKDLISATVSKIYLRDLVKYNKAEDLYISNIYQEFKAIFTQIYNQNKKDITKKRFFISYSSTDLVFDITLDKKTGELKIGSNKQEHILGLITIIDTMPSDFIFLKVFMDKSKLQDSYNEGYGFVLNEKLNIVSVDAEVLKKQYLQTFQSMVNSKMLDKEVVENIINKTIYCDTNGNKIMS